MASPRAVQLSLRKPTHATCVVGVETLVDVYRYDPGDFPVLRSGDSLAKVDAGGFWQGDVWTPEKVQLASELAREGNRVCPNALGSGHWVQSPDEGGLRKRL